MFEKEGRKARINIGGRRRDAKNNEGQGKETAHGCMCVLDEEGWLRTGIVFTSAVRRSETTVLKKLTFRSLLKRRAVQSITKGFWYGT